MLRTAAALVVLPLLLPPAPAPAAAATVVNARTPGGALAVVVTGTPSGTSARLRLKGPKKFTRTITVRHSKTLRRLRSGVYRVTAGKVTSDGRTWSPTVKPTKARVTGKKGARVLVRYRAESVDPQLPCDPAVEPCPGTEEPSQPFPGVTAPAGIALVSATAAGTSGTGTSRHSAWSPDSRSLTFGSCAPDLTAVVAGCWLYVRDLAASTTVRIPGTRLGDDLEWGGEPAWSPDGSRIAFVSSFSLVTSDTDSNSDVYLVPAGGGTPQRLSQSASGAGLSGGPYPPQARDPRWAPDGGSVLFRSGATSLVPGDTDEWVDLFVGTVADRALTRLPQGVDVSDARWSPDGRRIAFTSVRYTAETSLHDVHVVGADGSGGTAVTNDGVSSQPTWDPTGTRIAFASSAADVVPGDTNEASDIFVRDAVGGPATRISVASDGSQSSWSTHSPVWSPDGRRIAFVADSVENGIVIMVKDLISGALTQVTPGGRHDDCEVDDCLTTYFESIDPVWSPDGQRLAFTSTHPSLISGDGNNAPDVFVATL